MYRNVHCLHQTPIVPRFFALYRETKFFHKPPRPPTRTLLVPLETCSSARGPVRPATPGSIFQAQVSAISNSKHFLLADGHARVFCFCNTMFWRATIPFWFSASLLAASPLRITE